METEEVIRIVRKHLTKITDNELRIYFKEGVNLRNDEVTHHAEVMQAIQLLRENASYLECSDNILINQMWDVINHLNTHHNYLLSNMKVVQGVLSKFDKKDYDGDYMPPLPTFDEKEAEEIQPVAEPEPEIKEESYLEDWPEEEDEEEIFDAYLWKIAFGHPGG